MKKDESFLNENDDLNSNEEFFKYHGIHHPQDDGCFNDSEIHFDKKYGYLLFKKFISKGILNIIVLWIISKEKIHGYGIMKYLDNFFAEFIEKGFISKFNSSKIYPMLQILEKKEFIIGEWDMHDNKKVKYYTITPIGEKFLEKIRTKSKNFLGNDIWKEFFNDLGFEISFKER